MKPRYHAWRDGDEPLSPILALLGSIGLVGGLAAALWLLTPLHGMALLVAVIGVPVGAVVAARG